MGVTTVFYILIVAEIILVISVLLSFLVGRTRSSSGGHSSGSFKEMGSSIVIPEPKVLKEVEHQEIQPKEIIQGEKPQQSVIQKPDNPASAQPKPETDLFFGSNKEVSRFGISKLFKRSHPLWKEIKYHYGGYKLKDQDVEQLKKDLLTKYGNKIDKKEYIKEINKLIDEQHKQDYFDAKGQKEILKLREEERVLKVIGGLKGLVGKHQKITPKYNWSSDMTGAKRTAPAPRHDFLKNPGNPLDKR